MNRVRSAHNMDLVELAEQVRTYFSQDSEGEAEKAVERFYDDFRERECPICLDPFTKEDYRHCIETKCHHLFHSKCLRKWCEKNPTAQTCPSCKKGMQFETDYRMWKILRKALQFHFPQCVDSDEEIAHALQEQYNEEDRHLIKNVSKEKPTCNT